MKLKNANVKQRYFICLILGTLLSVTLGIITGLFRYDVVNNSIILVINGVLMALLFYRIGRSIQFRFSLSAAFLTLISIVISDIVATYGVAGLMSLELIVSTFRYALLHDMESIVWLAYRGLSLYISFSYSRIL